MCLNQTLHSLPRVETGVMGLLLECKRNAENEDAFYRNAAIAMHLPASGKYRICQQLF